MVDPLTMGVHGIEGLAVADASVMPLCPNSATHAPTMMLSKKAATSSWATRYPEHVTSQPTDV